MVPAGLLCPRAENQALEVTTPEDDAPLCKHPDTFLRCDTGCSMSSELSGNLVPGAGDAGSVGPWSGGSPGTRMWMSFESEQPERTAGALECDAKPQGVGTRVRRAGAAGPRLRVHGAPAGPASGGRFPLLRELVPLTLLLAPGRLWG